jgi:hypothetical protein
MSEFDNYKPVNTGLAEKVKKQLEEEKARLRALLPSAATSSVENTNVINENTKIGLSRKLQEKALAEKERLRTLMPSAINEAAGCGTPALMVAEKVKANPAEEVEQVEKLPAKEEVFEDAFVLYDDIEKKYSKASFIENDLKVINNKKKINEGKQKTININEINTLLYDVQKQLREKDNERLETLADDISEAIAETIISGSKSYNYDKFCGLINKFNESFDGE